jgi:hypothetical protein
MRSRSVFHTLVPANSVVEIFSRKRSAMIVLRPPGDSRSHPAHTSHDAQGCPAVIHRAGRAGAPVSSGSRPVWQRKGNDGRHHSGQRGCVNAGLGPDLRLSGADSVQILLKGWWMETDVFRLPPEDNALVSFLGGVTVRG